MDKILRQNKRTEIYKMLNIDKITLDKEIEYWNNPIKKAIDKNMEG
ncbi:hypothetical protein EOM39_01140 [Candidatus Gracilibacteria bacterium]|nr:hypothetical protein [Candidatus Gracilibacteria bacterium]